MHHTKLQINGSSGHCSHHEFHPPPEVHGSKMLLNRVFLENFDEVGIKTISGSINRICLESNILFMKMLLTFRPQLFLSVDELFYKLLEKNKISFKLDRKDYCEAQVQVPNPLSQQAQILTLSPDQV